MSWFRQKIRSTPSASANDSPESEPSAQVDVAAAPESGSLSNQGSGFHGQGQDWWSRLSETQRDMVGPLSGLLFEKLDDALFDRSGSSFQQFFEGMRILRKQRDVLLKSWFDRLDEAWKNLKPHLPGAFRPRLVSATEVANSAASLSLVDEMTLERNLAIDSAVARGNSLARMELPPLSHRLVVLRNGATFEADELPAAPAVLMRTFAQSLDEVPNLPVEVALVVFKLFDRVVMSRVGAICKELNRVLVLGGVVPQWTWAPAASRAGASRRMPLPGAIARSEAHDESSWLETVPGFEQSIPDANAFLAEEGPVGDGGFDAVESQTAYPSLPDITRKTRLTANVRALLEHRRLARYAEALGMATDRSLTASEALESLLSMDNGQGRGIKPMPALQLETLMEALAALPPPRLPTSWVGDVEEEWNPDLLKDELSRTLVRHVRKSGANKSPASAQAEANVAALGEYEDTIDMVAMMFGFIQQDKALPPAVQALLSRLQLPYLRLALTDQGVFSDPDHPARALMDRLAEVGKSCTPDSPMLAERMLRMHALVGRIVGKHDANRMFFEKEWMQFRAWSDAVEQRAIARERDQLAALAESTPESLSDTVDAVAEPVLPVAEPEASEIIEFESALERSLQGLEGTLSAKSENSIEKDHPVERLAVERVVAQEVDTQTSERAREHRVRLFATARMHECLDGRDVPEGLRNILSLLWVNRHIKLCLQFGEKSYEASWLRKQLDIIVGLLSVEPGRAAQSDFERDWPGVERAWAQVLAEGPASAEARSHWIAMFKHWADVRTGQVVADPACQWRWQDGMSAEASSSPTPIPPASVPMTSSMAVDAAVSAPLPQGEVAVQVVPQAAAGARPAGAGNKVAPARWTIGDWIEFTPDAGKVDIAIGTSAVSSSIAGRGKVSWIGTFTGRTILVKPDGTLWREESRTDLDGWLDSGAAFIVPRESLFDRSLQSMLRKLRDGAASAHA